MGTRGFRSVTAIIAAALVAACSSSSSPGVQAAGPTGIRGTELAEFSCAATSDGTPLQVAPSQVAELRVCQLVAPTPFNRPAHSITIMRGDAGFSALINALSLPDGHANQGQACPEYAELLPSVILSTGTIALRVHLPVDGCDHALPAVSTAIGAVTTP